MPAVRSPAITDSPARVDLGGDPGEDTYVFDLNGRGQVVGNTVAGNRTRTTLWTRR